MMKKILYGLVAVLLLSLLSCQPKKTATDSTMSKNAFISESQTKEVIKALCDSLGDAATFRIERGVAQVAALWTKEDGTQEEFATFCKNHFVADSAQLNQLFTSLERNFEIFGGYFLKMDLKLKEPLHLDGPELTPIDLLFGEYDPSAHLNDDLYASKIAFVTALNFPFYSLEEKSKWGESWTRQEWAYARMGDRFISRVPAEVQQNISQTLTQADTYISEYNIYMGNLLNEEGQTLFPKELKLISHWGLRDELKSNYADTAYGLEKQRMIYQVMKRIIDQTIPQEVINSDAYTWNPQSNALFSNGKEATAHAEPDVRYEVFLKNFHAMKQLDPYSPHYPSQLDRAFEETMEIPQEEVVLLFKSLLSSPVVKDVAAFIEARLGRKLEPFDIWYSGFKAAGGIPEDKLSALTTQKYPNPQALQKDLPNILTKLGWNTERANEITSLVTVDPSRGAGHAAGAGMKGDYAHLRTRFGANGMDYKGYNIAVHEFGHNVEQTITMNSVDYYTLNGVPNTAFTEALAFIFQKRDLALLGVSNPDPADQYLQTLANFWACYEIMGVSLVDIKVWEWMYQNPKATPAQLKEAVIAAAKEVWNAYYAGILGGKDETLLAIYSHMIDYPLYLPNYPMGHVIDFQIEQQIRDKNFAAEVERMYTCGRVIPQLWMKNAVQQPISITPLLEQTKIALKELHK